MNNQKDIDTKENDQVVKPVIGQSFADKKNLKQDEATELETDEKNLESDKKDVVREEKH